MEGGGAVEAFNSQPVSVISRNVARSFTLLLGNCPECGGHGGFWRENVKVPCVSCVPVRNWLESRFNFKVGEKK